MHNYLIIFCFTLFYTSVFYPRKSNGVTGVFMQVQGKRNRRVVVLLEGVMAVAAEVHPDLIEVIS